VRSAAFAEIGEALADLLELVRVAPSRGVVLAFMRDEWGAEPDEIAAALGALSDLLTRL
jgi:hypothetical protein